MASFLNRFGFAPRFHKGSEAQPTTVKKSFRPAIEGLEDRQLLAAALTASFEVVNGLGVLHVEGTEQADQIVVRQTYGGITVDGATIDGWPLVWASAVQVVHVKALGGDDSIYLNSEAFYWQQPIRALTFVEAGAGNDVVVGAAGLNAIYGGDGNDKLYGNSGSDVLFGGAGYDWLYGLAGDDRLDGGDQTDVLRGGDGLDILQGGGGIDVLLGDAGDDYLFYDSLDSDLGIVNEGTGKKNNILNGTQAQFDEAARAQLANIQLMNTMNNVQLAYAQLMNTSNNPQFLNNVNREIAGVLQGAFGSQGQSIFALLSGGTGGLTKLPFSPYNPGVGGSGFAPPNYTVP